MSDHSTVPLPLPPDPVAPRKRRRGALIWSVLAAILVVLVVALVAVDGAARSYAGTLIENKVRSSLSIPASTPVDAKVGGASVLLQLLAGKFERVDVSSKGLTVGALTGDATLTATGIPIDQSKPIDHARLEFTVDETQLKTLVGTVAGIPVNSLSVRSGAIALATTITVLGIGIPVTVAVAPSAVDGELTLTPKSVTFNGQTLSPADLRKTFGSLADTLLRTQKICVAQFLPKSLVLDAVTVSGSNVALAVSADKVTLNSDLFATKGVCASK
ncbi:DUF2993 domain-containing protein [Lacisediminihabitans sp.]|uniref:LmeA family phospholipid-binding protein n=1 Tax=Lacisediminihabitans sp. TaxID=2787631 RepID=UPI00374DF8D2